MLTPPRPFVIVERNRWEQRAARKSRAAATWRKEFADLWECKLTFRYRPAERSPGPLKSWASVGTSFRAPCRPSSFATNYRISASESFPFASKTRRKQIQNCHNPQAKTDSLALLKDNHHAMNTHSVAPAVTIDLCKSNSVRGQAVRPTEQGCIIWGHRRSTCAADAAGLHVLLLLV